MENAIKDETDFENSDYIIKQINDMKNDIDQLLQSLQSLDKDQVELSLADLNQKYEALNKLVSDSSLYLPKYNQKSAQSMLKLVRSEIDDKKDNLIPKSKFSFKTSLKTSHNCVKPAVKVIDEPDCSHPTIQFGQFSGFKNTSDRNDLHMSREEVNGKDIILDGLTNCIVEIRGSPNALKVNNLRDCRIFCGPITTSALINDCKKCLFKIAAQQLRIHTSSRCDLYLHVTSRAIIEESVEIRFAAYDWTYDSIAQDFSSAKLDIKTNNWQQIDDFDSLSGDRPSKNWSFIPIKNISDHSTVV